MFFLDLLLVLSLAVVLTAIFSAGFRRYRGSTLLIFFVLLVVMTWAAGLWIAPLGDPVVGVHWLSFLAAGILFALILLVLIPPTRSAAREKETAAGEPVLYGLFFWILLAVLLLAILAGYALDPFASPAHFASPR